MKQRSASLASCWSSYCTASSNQSRRSSSQGLFSGDSLTAMAAFRAFTASGCLPCSLQIQGLHRLRVLALLLADHRDPPVDLDVAAQRREQRHSVAQTVLRHVVLGLALVDDAEVVPDPRVAHVLRALDRVLVEELRLLEELVLVVAVRQAREQQHLLRRQRAQGLA